MKTSQRRVAALVLVQTILAGSQIAVAFAGPPAAVKPSAATLAAGKKVYESNHCMGCHKIAGKGGSSGPDLTTEGITPKRSVKWLTDEIVNPKANKPDGRMPAYKEKIQGKDLSDLVAYLRSPKK